MNNNHILFLEKQANLIVKYTDCIPQAWGGVRVHQYDYLYHSAVRPPSLSDAPPSPADEEADLKSNSKSEDESSDDTTSVWHL